MPPAQLLQLAKSELTRTRIFFLAGVAVTHASVLALRVSKAMHSGWRSRLGHTRIMNARWGCK